MSNILVEAIKQSPYTRVELSKISGVPLSTLSKWARNVSSPSAQSAINLLHVLGLSEQFDVKERMRAVRNGHLLPYIQSISGIHVRSLENYLYYGVTPSFRTYLDYMETMDRINNK